MQKTLEDGNIKLDSVLTDVMGKSGRAMIEVLIAGETNPIKLASLADQRVEVSAEELRGAVRSRVTKHHRFCCAIISIRSTLSKPPWRRSMPKWRPTSGPFAPRSS